MPRPTTTLLDRLRRHLPRPLLTAPIYAPWALDALALLGRFAVAAVFWQSGQTKVEGLVIDLVQGVFMVDSPRLAPGAVALFQDEYRLPLITPLWAAGMAALAEHLLPLMLLLGLGTRFAALGLLGMTALIQLLVYPGAYAIHGVWAAVLGWLLVLGPGRWSLDAAWAVWRPAGQGLVAR